MLLTLLVTLVEKDNLEVRNGRKHERGRLEKGKKISGVDVAERKSDKRRKE